MKSTRRRRRGGRGSNPPIDDQGTHLKIRPILNDLRFGGDAAENDDNLEAYFIETSSFLDVVSDEADLILGPKGSGKTAIFRRIANPDVEIKQIQDVDIVPAFNIQGSVFFQRLTPELSKLDEALLRTAWMAYVLGIVGNHLVDIYGDVLDTQPLEQTLTRIGLRARQDAPKSLWTVIASSLRRFSNPTAVETSLTFGESGVPILTGKAQYDRPSQSEGHPNEPADLEDLLSEEVGHFQRLGRRCWVMFDRLDEAFQHDRDLERAALKGLLRAHLDICSYGTPLRTKLFLRTDILHRVTEGSGFVNATHIRTQRISWDIKSIVDLVTKRIVGNETFRTTFEIEADETASEADRRSVVTKVLPAKMENLDIFSFMVQRTVDASDEPNPRNVITLLRLARQSQLRICDRDDPEYGLYGSLIGQDAMKAAMKELSSTRLEDTLFAEFHQLRPYVEKLKGRSFIYTREELAGVLSLSPNGDQFSRLVEDLKYSGFMRESGTGQLSVPILYRSALRLYSGRLQSHTYNPKREELQALAFERAEEALVTGVDQQLEPMDAADRMVVHVAVQKMPGVVAESMGEGAERRVVIRRARTGAPAKPESTDVVVEAARLPWWGFHFCR